MPTIGAHFAKELDAAGLLGLPFTWSQDGAFAFGDGMSDVQREAVLAVYAAHDPNDTTKIDAARDAGRVAEFERARLVRALVVWTAQKLGVPAAQARAEILALYRTLP